MLFISSWETVTGMRGNEFFFSIAGSVISKVHLSLLLVWEGFVNLMVKL